MKKIFSVLLITIAMVMLFAVPSFATDSWIGFGYQETNSFVSGSRYGISYGQKINKNIGLEASYIKYDTNDEDNGTRYSSSLYSIIDNEKKFAVGIDALYFINCNNKLSLYAGPGIYLVQYYDYYKDHSIKVEHYETGWIGAVSAGVQYKFNSIKIGLGYHLIRGINGQFCFSF